MMIVRKALVDDLTQIVELRIALLTELHEMQTEEEVHLVKTATITFLQRSLLDDSYISYVIEVDGKIVSTCGLVFINRPPSLKNLSGKEAYLLNVYTVPAYRKYGYAYVLLESCVQECNVRDVKRIFLHASEQGRPMYERYGFIEKEHEMDFFL